jgi:hypothetical protein
MFPRADTGGGEEAGLLPPIGNVRHDVRAPPSRKAVFPPLSGVRGRALQPGVSG